jgi:hypothetical protein
MKFLVLIALFSLNLYANAAGIDFSTCEWSVAVQKGRGDLAKRTKSAIAVIEQYAKVSAIIPFGENLTIVTANFLSDTYPKREARSVARSAIRHLNSLPGVTAECAPVRRPK